MSVIGDVIDIVFLKELSDTNEAINKAFEEQDCEVSLFSIGLILVLKAHQQRKQRLAKLKISQLLYELKSDKSQDTGTFLVYRDEMFFMSFHYVL